ncbi:hypothetical protein P153DRAFT_432624 [Dothidotthia symphoricarpi CBS 119687]|uniref:Uncharacterized protein n=1 Tax=Dothidotthia symphoricarpi CBS 119687 TaxID=1392245 RepID=A0A6A6A691_9PLEO|nr:uncharacterized protein P153DRAFT_432624 [Dothidotthia symphoricarpi CBS 119687]KAF2127492.1 hypothetical protein P153DRAFT_432624 [Dothidotthia symphoricarpi CBS 119687]
MSTSEPFNVDRIVSLWTELLQLQIDIGYYPTDDFISFPPPEGRPIDEKLCQELHLTDEVISLLKRLPCPPNFSEAYDTPIFDESMAVPFTDNEWIRNSRDLKRCWYANDNEPLRLDYLKPEELALVLEIDDTGRHLILDTKANTARFFIAMEEMFNPGEGEEGIHEVLDDPMHYRNYPARPAVEVLEELVATFRDLVWIPVGHGIGWPRILTAEDQELNEHTDAKRILQEQFGWPDNFDKEQWNRQRTEIWKRLLYSDEVRSAVAAKHLEEKMQFARRLDMQAQAENKCRIL